ncbi:MAG: hypothetical protein M5U01_31900 [Ardenticatenaceae bacterium]|nr:hypothetical protein [Ardenticatenaceae bacterium]HBY92561.1 hypothetical protein [Chloroflexota bacterium]
MRRVALAIALTLFVTSLVVPAALAANPHFINASANLDQNGNLVVSWKEAGLGDNQLIDYTASADATATYACINGGGKHPQATNKETVSGPVSASGTFSSGKNGQITASLTVPPPDKGDFSCPPGQRLVLASVSYTNVSITDTTNGITEPIPGTFSKTFFEV